MKSQRRFNRYRFCPLADGQRGRGGSESLALGASSSAEVGLTAAKGKREDDPTRNVGRSRRGPAMLKRCIPVLLATPFFGGCLYRVHEDANRLVQNAAQRPIDPVPPAQLENSNPTRKP